jgi:AraC-like DNA-binding protein
VLVSHRHHAPPLADAKIELDRVIGAHLVLRRVMMRKLIQDERVMVAPRPERRSRLLVVLSGRVLAFANGRSWELEARSVIALDRLSDLRTRGSAHTLEIDWDAGSAAGQQLCSNLELGRLAPPTMTALESLSTTLRSVRTEMTDAIEPAVARALSALGAEGFPLRENALDEALARPRAADQKLWTALDRALTRLEISPDTQDIVADLGWSRRTLARRLRGLDQRYHIYGDAGIDWRSQRDWYRLLVASMFLSHPESTTRAVSRMVGYRSPEALCHAFARAGLPSPGAIREAVRE